MQASGEFRSLIRLTLKTMHTKEKHQLATDAANGPKIPVTVHRGNLGTMCIKKGRDVLEKTTYRTILK